MARIGLEAFKRGVDNIPDSAFENIPYFGPKYYKEGDDSNNNNKNRNSSQNGNSNSKNIHNNRSNRMSQDNRSRHSRDRNYSDESDGSGYDTKSRRRRHRKDGGRASSHGGGDRGYDSDHTAQSRDPYFPPPPRVAVDEPLHNPQAETGDGEPYMARPYNPSEYGADPGTRDNYYRGHPQERGPLSAGAGAGAGAGGLAPSAAASQRSRSAVDMSRHAPTEYGPRDTYRRQDSYDDIRSASPGYDSALALQHPRYSDDNDSYDDDRGRERGLIRSKSRGSARSKSRGSMSQYSAQLKEGFEKNKKEVGAGALGAVAGGIIGNIVTNATSGGNHRKSKSKSKTNIGGMLIGAAIGGIGAAAIERQMEKKKREKQDHDYDDYDRY